MGACQRLTPLGRPDETQVDTAGEFGRHDHCLFAGVALRARRRWEARAGHPVRGGVHAGGAVEELEGARATILECIGGDAGSSPGTSEGQAMVDYAMNYLGYPYIWATHGPKSGAPDRARLMR